MRRTREGVNLYFFFPRTLLFGLLYASGRFEEAHTLGLELHPFLGALPETYRTYIQEMAQYQKESTPSPVEDQAKLARKALEGIDGLTDYLKAYPNDGRAMLIRFTEAPQRFYEEEEIAQFVNYLFLRGAECLDESDNDQGTQKILAYLTLERSQIRAQLPQETFNRIWKIIYLLRRIERIVGKGALQVVFQKCLDSDDDFTTMVARDMLLHEWWTDQEVVKAYQDFLLWITPQRLGVGAYHSSIFSPQQLEAQARHKKRTRRVDVEEEPALETESLTIRDPIGEWEFFVSAHNAGDVIVLSHSKEAFDAYFGNQFVVSGERILKKLQYFLMHEEYQRNIFPPLVVDIYKGYRRLKVAGVRIFWKLDSQQKKLYFFVKNRRDAYR
jgi:mRNA-degrading endonuclease RelE of RelBE toxin-antitoxin system